MAKNEVMVITEDDINNKLTLSATDMDVFKWLTANAGIEMDEQTQAEFIASRNAKIGSITRIAEFSKWCEKTQKFCDTILKHAFNVGTVEQFPKNVSLKNNGSTTKFVDGMAAALVCDTLIRKKLATKEMIFGQVTPSIIEKATGLKKDKIVEMFPDVIAEEKKAPTLVIK